MYIIIKLLRKKNYRYLYITSLALAFNLACSGSSVFARLFAARKSNSRSCSSCFLRSTLSKSSKNFNCALTSCVTSYLGST